MRRVDEDELRLVINKTLYFIDVDRKIVLAPEPIEAWFHTKQSSLDGHRRIKRERQDDVRTRLGPQIEQDQQRFRRPGDDLHVLSSDALNVGNSLSQRWVS